MSKTLALLKRLLTIGGNVEILVGPLDIEQANVIFICNAL